MFLRYGFIQFVIPSCAIVVTMPIHRKQILSQPAGVRVWMLLMGGPGHAMSNRHTMFLLMQDGNTPRNVSRLGPLAGAGEHPGMSELVNFGIPHCSSG